MPDATLKKPNHWLQYSRPLCHNPPVNEDSQQKCQFCRVAATIQGFPDNEDNNNENKDKNPQRSQRQNSLCCMEVKTISGIRASLSSVPSCCSYLDKGKTKLSQPFSVLFGGSIYTSVRWIITDTKTFAKIFSAKVLIVKESSQSLNNF